MNAKSCHCCGKSESQVTLVNGGDGDWANYYCMEHVPWERTHELLRKPLVRVCWNWGFFRQAYGTQASYDLLKKAADAFFTQCRQALVRDIILTICQITDPAKQGDKENLTLQQMLSRMKAQGCDPNQIARLEQQLGNVQKVVAPFRDLRNKRFAHLDFEVNLGLEPLSRKPPEQAPAPDVTGQNVEDAVYEIRLFMWEAKHAPNRAQPTKPYQIPCDIPGDAAELIRKLKLLDQQGPLR